MARLCVAPAAMAVRSGRNVLHGAGMCPASGDGGDPGQESRARVAGPARAHRYRDTAVLGPTGVAKLPVAVESPGLRDTTRHGQRMLPTSGDGGDPGQESRARV